MKVSRIVWRGVNVVMLLAFAFSVVVQINDPDPLYWMAIYGAAAAACALELAGKPRWWLSAAVAAIALVWALGIAPRVVGQVPFRDMFGAFEMANEGIEASREMYGLLIVAAWMIALSLSARLNARTAASRSSRSSGPDTGR